MAFRDSHASKCRVKTGWENWPFTVQETASSFTQSTLTIAGSSPQVSPVYGLRCVISCRA